MKTLEFVQDTTVSDNSIYEVDGAEEPTSGDSSIARLQEDLTTERERRLRLLAEFDNYRRRTKQVVEIRDGRETPFVSVQTEDEIDDSGINQKERQKALEAPQPFREGCAFKAHQEGDDNRRHGGQ